MTARSAIALLAVATALAAVSGPSAAPAAVSRPPAGDGGADLREGVSADSVLAQLAATSRFRRGQPVSLAWTPDDRSVLFLRSGPRSFVQDLYQYDIATGREREILTADSLLKGGIERLSVEELARRERQRQTARGIASFQLSRDGRWILVPLSDRLFVVERSSGAVHELARLVMAGAKTASGPPIDPRFSPDGTMIAYVLDHDLYVRDIATGLERRLTEGGGGAIANGEAEFVAQEEMDRDHGYWWSPDGRTIACQHTDLTGVEVLSISDPAHPERAPQAWPYPRPGKKNADVSLNLVPVEGGAATAVRWDRDRYPYLATVVWEKNAPLTILVQNREQTEEVLLAVDPATGATTALLTERDDAWLNLFPGMPHWLKDGRSFLWMTERGGATQLELRGRDGKLVRALTPSEPGLRAGVDVDEARGVSYVRGGNDPTQIHLFRVPLDPRRGKREQVTREAGIHGGVFSEDGRVYVETLSPQAGPPRWIVRGPDGRAAGELTSRAETPRITPRPEWTTVRDSLAFRAVILRPHDFTPGNRYPVIVSVYGGPHSQMVMASAQNYLIQQWLADQGFVVVSIDGRGTPGRGRAWERAIRGDLIDVPLRDQAAALAALGRQYPEMDLTRVGITGWSFGGYFTVLALERLPQVFHAGVAGAPVTDWRDYDTHYTERYMGLPERNPSGYDASSALTWAKDLARPLLILHGTADDNVYFMHSLKLCDALVRSSRTFEMVPLGGYTHMVADSIGVTQVNLRIARHFRRTLGLPQ